MFSFSFFIFGLYTGHSIYWDIFTSRDIHRSLGWLEGRPYWPGPEMSGGNNLPGPFFYFLLFPALFFGKNIYSQALLWCLGWFALTYAVAFSFLGKIIKHRESLLIFLLLFVTAMGEPLFAPFAYSWNAGFAVLFHILALTSLYYWRETNKNKYLCLLGLVIALGIQVHLLVVVHVITVLLFYGFDTHKKSFLSICFFVSLAILPVCLYGIIIHFYESSFFDPVDHLIFLIKDVFSGRWFKNIGKIFDFPVMGIFLFVLFMVFQKREKKWPFTGSTGNLFAITAVPSLMGILGARTIWYMFFIPVFLMLFVSKCCDDLMPENSDKRSDHLLVCGFILIGSLFLFNGDITSLLSFIRYFDETGGYLVAWFFGLILLFWMINTKCEWTCRNMWKTAFFVVLLLIAGQTQIIRELSPRKSSIEKTFKSTWPRYQELYPLMKRIYLETNWQAKKAVQRIYFIGVHPSISLFSYYSMTGQAIKKKVQSELLKDGGERQALNDPVAWNSQKDNDIYPGSGKTKDKTTGYMIIQHLKKFTTYSKKKWEWYLSHSSLLVGLLRQEILEGKVIIKNPELYDRYWLIPYKVTKESVFVNGFYNIGQAYSLEQPEWLENCVSTQKFKNEGGFYYCMVLPGHLQRAGVRISFHEDIQKRTGQTSSFPILETVFFGYLIEVSSWAYNLDGSALWSDIQISLSCGGTHYTHDIPDMGNNWMRIKRNPELQGQQFTAPLRLRIPVSYFTALSESVPKEAGVYCKRKNIKNMELTFIHSYQKNRRVRDPSQKIKVIWE